MINQGVYDVIDCPFPLLGMNQTIAPDRLDPRYGWIIENILPDPLGAGTVRPGTWPVEIPPPEGLIEYLEVFPFFYQSVSQKVFYASVWKPDLLAINFIIAEDKKSFRLSTQNALRYEPTVWVKVTYKLTGDLGQYTLAFPIKTMNRVDQTITIQLTDQRLPPTIESIQSIAFGDGQIYVWNGIELALKKSGLSTACIPRAALDQKRLLICNGVDRIMSWNGATLEDVWEWVKETEAQAFQRLNDKQFRCTVNAVLAKAAAYQDNRIRLVVGDVSWEGTVTAVNLANTTLTITTQETLPVFPQNAAIELFYKDYPPRMNYLIIMHDRIWGLGTGAASLGYRSGDQAMRVYYSYGSADRIGDAGVTQWFNEQTRTVPSLDLSGKQEVMDNLEAIATLGSLTIFFGRHRTQVWMGNQPPVNDDTGNFQWIATKGVGITHGNLLLSLPNDLYFVSFNGILSAGTLNIGNQFAVDASANAVNPLVRQWIDSIVSDELAYRRSKSWAYRRGRFAAFKIGLNKLIAARVSTTLDQWFLLSGDFENASVIWDDLDDNLYLAVNTKVLRFGDGHHEVQSFADQGNTKPIYFAWGLPTIVIAGKRIALKRYEVGADYPADFFLNELNSLRLSVFGDLRKSFHLTSRVPLGLRGDLLNQKLLAPVDDPPVDRFHLETPYAPLSGRLSAVSSSLELILEGWTLSGPLTFHTIRLFTIFER